VNAGFVEEGEIMRLPRALELTVAVTALVLIGARIAVAQTTREPAVLRESGEIRGTVSFCGTQGSNGVQVHLAGKSFSVTTGPSGEFQFFYVPAGPYTLVVQVPGLAPTTQAIDVVAKQVTLLGTIAACPDNDHDGHTVATDCNDNNPSINPAAAESCDGHDNDCDGTVDEACPTCTDADNDGFKAQPSCGTAVDCNDGKATINPAASELCDGIDNNCNGTIDEGFHLDTDEQNCGSCGFVCPAGDLAPLCNAGVCRHPFLEEVCNGIDDDGNSFIDDGLGIVTCGVGACRTQVAACLEGLPQTCTPSAPANEVCNGVDDDCDGTTDEGCGVVCMQPLLNCGNSCVDTMANVNHCGACGESCSLPNATPSCVVGTCRVQSCNSGFYDCDGNATNGCESTTQCQLSASPIDR
jgi:hypothetical protein